MAYIILLAIAFIILGGLLWYLLKDYEAGDLTED